MHIEAKTLVNCSPHEIWEIFQLRACVFVVEQNCAYQDVDEKDLKAWHVCMRVNDELVAYCRILPPGVSYSETSIGRVVVPQHQRGKSFAKQLMQWSIDYAFKHYPSSDIVISAQTYLLDFYKALGFIPEGDNYLEDNIPHQKMRLLI